MQAMESQFDVCTEDLFNQTIKLEEMEKKAGNAEGEVSSQRDRRCRGKDRPLRGDQGAERGRGGEVRGAAEERSEEDAGHGESVRRVH